MINQQICIHLFKRKKNPEKSSQDNLNIKQCVYNSKMIIAIEVLYFIALS